MLRRITIFLCTHQSLIKNSLWLFLQQTIIVCAGFGLSIALGYFLQKELYGSYRFVLSVIGVATITCLMGSQVALVKSIAQQKNIHPYWILLKKSMWGILGAFATALVGIYQYHSGHESLGYTLLIASLFVPFFDSVLLFDSYLRGHERFKAVALSRGIIQVLASLVLVSFIFYYPNSLAILVLSYLAVYSLLRAVALYLLVPFNGLSPSESDRQCLNYSKHITTSLGLGVVAHSFDKLLIFYLLGPVSVASFAFALIVPDQIKGLLKQVMSILLPKFSQENSRYVLIQTRRVLVISIFVTGCGTLLYILVAPHMYQLLFPRYLESIALSQIASISLIPSAGYFVLRNSIYALEAKKIMYLTSTLQPLLQITAVLLGAITYGLMGIAFALICANTIALIMSYYLLFYSPYKVVD